MRADPVILRHGRPWEAESKLLYDMEMDRRRKAGIAAEVAVTATDDGDAAWLASVQAEFLRQCDELDEKLMKEQELADLRKAENPADFDTVKFYYGSPLEEDNMARLGFWPRYKDRLFLFFYPASVTFIKSYTAMKMERTNSAADYTTAASAQTSKKRRWAP